MPRRSVARESELVEASVVPGESDMRLHDAHRVLVDGTLDLDLSDVLRTPGSRHGWPHVYAGLVSVVLGLVAAAVTFLQAALLRLPHRQVDQLRIALQVDPE